MSDTARALSPGQAHAPASFGKGPLIPNGLSATALAPWAPREHLAHVGALVLPPAEVPRACPLPGDGRRGRPRPADRPRSGSVPDQAVKPSRPDLAGHAGKGSRDQLRDGGDPASNYDFTRPALLGGRPRVLFSGMIAPRARISPPQTPWVHLVPPRLTGRPGAPGRAGSMPWRAAGRPAGPRTTAGGSRGGTATGHPVSLPGCRRAQQPVAWLSLDVGDNDPAGSGATVWPRSTRPGRASPDEWARCSGRPRLRRTRDW